MKTVAKAMAGLAACVMLAAAGNASAINVDGVLDAAYGAPTAVVGYDPDAPHSNFQDPRNVSKFVGYSIYLNSSNGYVYGMVVADTSGGGASGGAWANLYWDLDPAAANGSDYGFEIGLGANNQRAFIAGKPPTSVTVAGVLTAGDANAFEFAIPTHLFTTYVPGLDYWPEQDADLPDIGDTVVLRLSQSLGYSVAGGATYGPDRLGAVTLSAAVPEPATWAMMIGGFGLAGAVLRRRRALAGA